MTTTDSTTARTTVLQKLPPCPICGSTQAHAGHIIDPLDTDETPTAVIVMTPAGPQLAWAALMPTEPVQLALL